MGDVININDHITEDVIAIETQNGDVHLIPEKTIMAIINGERSITTLYDWEEIVKAILITELEAINE